MWWRALVEAVFPTLCPGCGRRAEPVCAECARTLRVPPPALPPAGLDGWVAPLAYEGVARELVARVKYRHARATLPWLAAAVAGAVAADHAPGSFDAVTWAPTTPDRRRRRGFDHAELLAREVARSLGLPPLATLTRGPGPPQTGLRSAARRAGPTFRIRAAVPGRVLLVDDVTTTGATLASAARVLRPAGATRIVAATAARTPPRLPPSSRHAEREILSPRVKNPPQAGARQVRHS
jgi:predicted amidophosphoribosyltransferase